MSLGDRFSEANPYEPPRAQEVEVGKTARTQNGIDLAVENPFLTIWTRPRATIRAIVDRNPLLHFIPLAMVGGIARTLDRASSQNAGDALPLSAIVGLAIILGPVGGIIGVYVGQWFIGSTGRWLGGQASAQAVRTAIAWSNVPIVATIPIWVLQIGLLGREVFTRETPSLDSKPALAMILMASFILEAVLGVWSFLTLLKCVAEVQRFSAWRALSSLILVGVIVLVPIMLVLILFYVLRI